MKYYGAKRGLKGPLRQTIYLKIKETKGQRYGQFAKMIKSAIDLETAIQACLYLAEPQV